MPTLPNTSPFRGIIGFSRLRSEAHHHPMVIVRGEGVHLFDRYGRDYLGGLANFYSASLGFSEPELIEAAKDQLAKIANFSTLSHKLSEPTEALAERLAEILPLEEPLAGTAIMAARRPPPVSEAAATSTTPSGLRPASVLS